MDGELRAAMTAGVFVEFQDDLGNTVGQAVFTGWQGRPVPNVGDTVCCAVQMAATGRRRRLLGRVTRRHFEMQHEDDGQPCVWVRLAMQTIEPPAPRPKPHSRIRFSAN
ncbi:MAG TPA: hypothetical protein VFI31_01185 [Pirellulales bacterium]|nr:hypothetical protein [Pirellulales bacterium]